MIFWAGRSSDDVGVVVEHYPARSYPQRKLETVSVPGRSGALLTVQDAFENYEQTYDVYLSAERLGLPRAARAAADWLVAPRGYQRLEDSYDLDTFRLAYYAGPTDVENIMNRFGRASISFNCQPQRWLRVGEVPVQLVSGQALRNPTGFTALPKITVRGTGAGVLTVGDVAVTIKSLNRGSLILDCDTQDAYLGAVNLNSTISAPEFPSLPAGETAISWSGGISAVEIIPRWWAL